jgi:hypothetical protein
MKKDSRNVEALLLAVSRGMKMTPDGQLIGLRGKRVKGSKNHDGYWCGTVRVDGRPVRVACHHLQAYQKFGEELFNPGVVVRHRFDNKDDNSEDNIILGTQGENMLDVPAEVRLARAKKGAAVVKSFTDDQIRDIRSKAAAGFSYKKIIEEYGMSKSTLSYIINRKTYADVEDL